MATKRFERLMATLREGYVPPKWASSPLDRACSCCAVSFTLAHFRVRKTGLDTHCKGCRKAAEAEREAKFPGRRAAQKREKRALNPGSSYTPAKAAQAKTTREKNRAWVAASVAKFKAEFPEEYAAKTGEKAMRRVAAKIQRTPTWSSPESCRVAYRLRVTLQKATGVRHAVDHSVPLRGKLVSGLHVAENLIVITHEENGIKGNRFDPMTYEWWPECCPKPPIKGTSPTLSEYMV
jgi:hypothetical protein